MAINDLKTVLGQRAGFELLDVQTSDNQLRIVGRVPPNASSQWVVIVHHLLSVSESSNSNWKVDISRQYFLRPIGTTKKLFYSWRIIFQAPNIDQHLQHIVSAIASAPRPARVELQEFPLTGASRNYSNGKGAFAVGETPTVMQVALAARMGGTRT